MIKAPVLVFLGGRDGLVGPPAAAARRARCNIGKCEIEVLPDAGHVMSVDEPDFAAKRSIEFLS
jgi:pimeloyl-ACP methyl ester carboxylesterase